MADVHNLQSLLRSLCSETSGERVSVADLLNAVGRRSYGPVILLLGFVAISPLTLVPGANFLVASVILIFALQMVVGRDYPWLPKKALAYSFPRKYLISGAEALDKHAHSVDQLLKPRLTFLTRAPFVQLVALALVAAALVTFPLSFIPLGPVLPSLTVLFFGLAISARDGFLLIVAGATLIAAVILMAKVWTALPFV
ncbi:MAG: exopolysaccharide biosynthesis protein [Pseudomonadota bacterium]